MNARLMIWMLFCVLAVVYPGFSFAQDSTVLFENAGDYWKHTVYIERDRSADIYGQLASYGLEGDGRKAYQKILRDLKKMTDEKPLKHKELIGDYLPVIFYDGQYYLYAPCDWGNHTPKRLTRTEMMTWQMDGVYPDLYTRVQKSKHGYIIDFAPAANTWIDACPSENRLVIRKIPGRPGLYLFENLSEGSEGQPFELYVRREHMKDLPVIVNHRDGMKQDEWYQPPVDYLKLIQPNLR
jgi:hypothetical protein